MGLSKPPSWTVCVQIMTPEPAREHSSDQFDVAKVLAGRGTFTMPRSRTGEAIIAMHDLEVADDHFQAESSIAERWATWAAAIRSRTLPAISERP